MRAPIDFSSPYKLIEVPHPNSRPNQNNLAQSNISISLTDSPVQLHNKYGPLLRCPNQKPPSSSTVGSSSSSGPIFPPGFEDRIPPHVKLAQVEKREKRLEKKKKLKSQSRMKKAQDSSAKQNFGAITVDDVIDLSSMLGLSFDGHINELRRRI